MALYVYASQKPRPTETAKRQQRIDDSPPQLLEVIEERHLTTIGLRNRHPGSRLSSGLLARAQEVLGESGFV